MNLRISPRLIVSVAVLAIAGFGMAAAGTFSAGCTDGATPDCTGDASASCGLLPNEGGTIDEGGNVEGGNTTDAGTDADTNMDTGVVDMDAQTDDSGDADDAGG